MAYWQGDRMIVLTEDQTEITGDVIIRAVCKHENGTAAYTLTADGMQHVVTWSCCGTEATEPHTMNSTTGKCVCGAELAVASVTVGGIDTYYETLKDAIAAAAVGTKDAPAAVTVLKNIDIAETIQVSSGVFTLNLNGKILRDYEGDGLPDGIFFLPSNSTAHMTIADTEGGKLLADWGAIEIEAGSVTITGGDLSYAENILGDSVSIDGGTLNISGGTVLGVDASGGTVNISGGTVLGVDAYFGSTVNISGGSIRHLSVESAESNVKLSGGEFMIVDCWETKVSELLADGYSYWNQEGTTMLNPEYDTDLDNVIVKATCLHPEEKLTYVTGDSSTHTWECSDCNNNITEAHTEAPTYTLTSDGAQHIATYACCGTIITEDHDFENEAHKCACGVIEIFTYQVKTYTMDPYGDYGEPVTEEKSAPYGTQVNATPNSGAEGFYLDTEHADSLLTATVPANDDLVLKVYIGREQYPITWDLNGGEADDDNLPESMYYGISQLTIFGGFAKEGHAFSYLEDQFGNQYRDATPDNDFRWFRDVDMPVGGLTLKVIWNVNAYALHVQDQTLDVDYGTALTDALSGITPEKTGYTFTGWSYYYLDDEGVEQPYTGTTMPASDLYAQPVFTPIEYNITWILNGCTVNTEIGRALPETLPYTGNTDAHQLKVALNDPAGYRLTGFKDGDGNKLNYSLGNGYLLLPVTGDMTVEAVIEPESYVATWETGDGGSHEKKFKYGETITIPDSEIFRETFRKAGYTLVGWEGYTEGMTMPIGGVTFQAKWQINPASLDVTSTPYTGQPHAPTVTVEGLTEGTDFTVTYPEDMTNAGEKIITVTGKLGGTTTVTYTIEKAPAPVITFPTVLNAITYGQQLQEAKLSFYENELGGFDWTAPIGVPGSAGVYDYALDFYPADLRNYDWEACNWETHGATWIASRNALCAMGRVTVNRAASMMETAPTEKTLTYNGQPQELITAGTVLGGTLQYSVNGGEWSEAVPTAIEAGNYQISYQVVGNSNYVGIGASALPMVQIQQATLTVTAQDHTITYGDTPSDNGITYDGFVNGETEAVLGGAVTYTYNYAQFGNVGTYKITPGGVTSDNYEITFMDGILTVNPKGITEADVELTGTLTYTGRQQTQAVAVADGVTYEVTGNQATNAGTYQLTVTGTGNYSGSVTKTWSIAKAEQTIQVTEPQEMVCGESHDLSASAETRLTYVSSDPAVVSVDENGTMTALKAGTVTITITAQETDNYLSAQKTITVTVGHSYEAEITRPTCEDKGYTTYTCVCGDSYVADYVSASGHAPKAAVEENRVEATCEKDGSYEMVTYCGTCDKELSRTQHTIDAIGHDYDDGVITTKPGCETEGVKTFTCANDKSHTYTEKVPATGHEYTAVVTAPTCEDKGYTTYTCVCGDSYVADYVSATGHSFGSWKVTKDPTCTVKGQERRDCEKCDHFESRDTAALGHEYQDPMDATCQICDERRDVYVESIPMFRLYNPNTGEHHYTGSVVERDMLVEAGWNYEGVAWNAPVEYGEPVCRYYNPNTGDHHYTMCATEGEELIEAGWIYEGVAWNSASADHLPIYRLYNPNAITGTHHYTGSAEERDMLVEEGWRYEGIAWYALLH